MAYLSLAEAKDYLPADTELTDAQILKLVALIEETFESICGQPFEPRTGSLVLDGSGRNVQPLPTPIVSVSTVEVRRAGGTWETVTYGDLRVLPSRKMLSAGNVLSPSQRLVRGAQRSAYCCAGSYVGGACDSSCVFPAGSANLRITGDWGDYSAAPRPIADAAGQLLRNAASCDDDRGPVATPYEAESVPEGRAYTMRKIVLQAKMDRMTGFAEIDSVLARYKAPFGVVTVL